MWMPIAITSTRIPSFAFWSLSSLPLFLFHFHFHLPPPASRPFSSGLSNHFSLPSIHILLPPQAQLKYNIDIDIDIAIITINYTSSLPRKQSRLQLTSPISGLLKIILSHHFCLVALRTYIRASLSSSLPFKKQKENPSWLLLLEEEIFSST
ncbi:hypothetical protein VTL71DRAFT_996 [Oculimacula yallundae]|uniref:Uncharacterized protein n=1 Tax=Oculimacula yallundae TaxID=86028 RepID=A0ABR4D1M1_9HELO